MEVHVADAVPAAEHRARSESVGEAEPGTEVVAVGGDQRTVFERAVAGHHHGPPLRVEVGQHVVAFPVRRGVLVAQPEIERELIGEPQVVLDIGEVHVLAQVGHQDVAEGIGAAEPQHEVGKVVHVARGCPGRPGELPRVLVAPVERVHVLHFRLDVLELIARLDGLASTRPRVVDLRIEHGRKLPLRVGGLAPQIREPCDELRGKPAGHPRIRGEPLNAEQVRCAAGAERRRVLARNRVRPGEPELHERRVRG